MDEKTLKKLQEAKIVFAGVSGVLSEDDLEDVAGGIFPPLSSRKFPKRPPL